MSKWIESRRKLGVWEIGNLEKFMNMSWYIVVPGCLLTALFFYGLVKAMIIEDDKFKKKQDLS